MYFFKSVLIRETSWDSTLRVQPGKRHRETNAGYLLPWRITRRHLNGSPQEATSRRRRQKTEDHKRQWRATGNVENDFGQLYTR